jgi:predicted glycoside hydrolase/deacetylase ChbG (UPF0249 family)
MKRPAVADVILEARMQAEPNRSEPSAPPRRIWICADDYGLSDGVSTAIRDLIARGRLNATSVMVVSPNFRAADAAALAKLNDDMRRVAIGLHVTLTAPFRPLTGGYAPLRNGAFLPLGEMLARACLHTLNVKVIAEEVAAQLRAFTDAFGRMPDFIDGHQHVQVFPQVREAVLSQMALTAPSAWIRQCGRAGPVAGRFTDRKGLLLDVLSRGFRSRAAQLGLRTNPAFAGTYDFNAARPFADRFAGFLDTLPDGGLVMCHPGHVDAELARLDPLTTARAQEYAFFAGHVFPAVLAERGIALA